LNLLAYALQIIGAAQIGLDRASGGAVSVSHPLGEFVQTIVAAAHDEQTPPVGGQSLHVRLTDPR
jgi:hypothetical protein